MSGKNIVQMEAAGFSFAHPDACCASCNQVFPSVKAKRDHLKVDWMDCTASWDVKMDLFRDFVDKKQTATVTCSSIDEVNFPGLSKWIEDVRTAEQSLSADRIRQLNEYGFVFQKKKFRAADLIAEFDNPVSRPLTRPIESQEDLLEEARRLILGTVGDAV